MTSATHTSKFLVVSTFPPAKCGIASFAQDLVSAITAKPNPPFQVEVCALDKESNAGLYDRPVKMIMDGYNIDSCLKTAALINKDPSIDIVCIEHEFGLYGGELGDYLLAFIALLEKPFVITFHTVLPQPTPKRLKVVEAIQLLAEKIIVMTKNSARILERDYGINARKIKIIPHGTHPRSRLNVRLLKESYNFKDNLLLTTFGLLSPNKGIEKGILAMKEISQCFPHAIYLVIGNTHPNLLVQEGEKYRNYLQELINNNNLQKNVKLVNNYLPVNQLMEYLSITDIYLFTSKDPDQAVSGTFLYAMSAGCAIISNSFVLAEEMLDSKTGIILKGNDEHELSQEAIFLLQDPHARKEMGNNAYLKTKETSWENIATHYTDLFSDTMGIPIQVSLCTP